jgi:DNA ligase (NAD+)
MDAPTISDVEYDKKYNELEILENESNFWLTNSPTRKVQGEVLPYLTKVKHSIPMLSADKSTDIKDVKKFIKDKSFVASYKLDGSTVVVKYQDGNFYQGLSRGSGVDGEDITHTVKMIKNLPMTIPYKGYLEIRGEALIPWKYYNEMNKDGTLGHPRNVASGGLRQLNAEEAAKRNIYFYAFTLVNWKDVLPTLPWSNGKVVWSKYETLEFLKEAGYLV